jgi:hypothetical protein
MGLRKTIMVALILKNTNVGFDPTFNKLSSEITS